MKNRKQSKLITPVIAFIFILSACNPNEIYYSYEQTDPKGWSQEQSISFRPTLPDSTLTYNVSVLLRYNNNYDYRNLWLFIEYGNGKGSMKRDTLNCELADKFGKWYGSGWGSLYQQEIPFLRQYRFDTTHPTIKVWQGMRDEVVSEIKEIGLKINKTE